MIPIRCATCGEASQIDEAWIGRWVGCPHCRRPTLATATAEETPDPAISPPPPPAAPPLAAAPPPPPSISPPAGDQSQTTAVEPPPSLISPRSTPPAEPAARLSARAEAEPPAKRAPLTRDQRLAIRRRRHLILAIGGAIILLATAYALLSVGN